MSWETWYHNSNYVWNWGLKITVRSGKFQTCELFLQISDTPSIDSLLWDGELVELFRLHRDNGDDDGGDVRPVSVVDVFRMLPESDNRFFPSPTISLLLDPEPAVPSAWYDGFMDDAGLVWDDSSSDVSWSVGCTSSVAWQSALGAWEIGSPPSSSLQRISVISNRGWTSLLLSSSLWQLHQNVFHYITRDDRGHIGLAQKKTNVVKNHDNYLPHVSDNLSAQFLQRTIIASYVECSKSTSHLQQ